MTEEEVFDFFMQMYPAYTVRQIEEELSWREVDAYARLCKDRLPDGARLKRIETILAKAHGMRLVAPAARGDDSLIAELRGIGWL